MRPSDEKIIFGNTDKFRRQTGWKPTLTIEETLASMLKYWDRAEMAIA
jgi:GDP-4-dehydro-6-deoxy-D-mannose reductase